MENVLFFDIPKLKPNYSLIVIGICQLLMTIYSLTKVYLPDLMLGVYHNGLCFRLYRFLLNLFYYRNP